MCFEFKWNFIMGEFFRVLRLCIGNWKLTSSTFNVRPAGLRNSASPVTLAHKRLKRKVIKFGAKFVLGQPNDSLEKQNDSVTETTENCFQQL